MRSTYDDSRHTTGNSLAWLRYRSPRTRAVASRSRSCAVSMGWNSRRRTISKLSSAVAGRHDDSIRPMTERSRRRASRPPAPPTSMAEPLPGPSSPLEAGMDTTSKARSSDRVASVSSWAKLKCVSKVPPGRVSSRYRTRA